MIYLNIIMKAKIQIQTNTALFTSWLLCTTLPYAQSGRIGLHTPSRMRCSRSPNQVSLCISARHVHGFPPCFEGVPQKQAVPHGGIQFLMELVKNSY